MHTVSSLAAQPNSLAPHYAAFRVHERLLLTGHSHQAWPDCAAEGQVEAFRDAAELVDDKWSRAFAKADDVRAGYARLLGAPDGTISLAASTHELVVRFLSALPLRSRPRLLSTDGEFHSLRRQLDRLREEGIEVVKVPARPVSTLAERLCDELRADASRTSAVLVSTVLFGTGEIVPGLGSLADACQREGVPLLLDAYHQLNVVPVDLVAGGLTGAYVVGGGYKYCQLGEGNGFLRAPAACTLRPAITGWFSEFATIDAPATPGAVAYGAGAARFAGATYDPTSHYRAARVFAFFQAQGLTPRLLREVSQHQLGVLSDEFDRLDLDEQVIRREREVPRTSLGGFLALRSERAAELCDALRARGVLTDCRAEVLRLGPAPYLSDAQLAEAIGLLGESARQLARR